MSIENIIKELNNLPRGYISKKNIKGKEYSYLQSMQDGKIQSIYLRESELDRYTEGIKRRKELEQQLRELQEQGKNAASVSKRAREMTGSLMSGDIEVARFERGEMTFCNENMAPLMLVRTKSVSTFLASRAIDSSRTNSRLLKKALDIHGEPDEVVSLYAHGATITDNYWFKPKGSKLKYDDICFDSDAYSEIALNGQILIYNKRSKLTPQLTLGGSYEKCWKLIGGEWWMYKRGSETEILSELISSHIAELIGISTAYYEYANGDIRTRNFADKYNFEPMSSVVGEDDRTDSVYDALCNISEDIAKDYLKLIIFDAIVKNEDRHNENCGLMRDKKTGKIVGLAPNFDNNISLFSRSTTLNMDPSKDGLIQYLLKFVNSRSDVAEVCSQLELTKLFTKTVLECIETVDASVIDEHGCVELCHNINRRELAEFISARSRYVLSQL